MNQSEAKAEDLVCKEPNWFPISHSFGSSDSQERKQAHEHNVSVVPEGLHSSGQLTAAHENGARTHRMAMQPVQQVILAIRQLS